MTSSVLVWPTAEAVREAAASWAADVLAWHPGVVAVGIVGSLADGRWGVGSDVDLVLVAETDAPFVERSLAFDPAALPVPADLLVYTPAEWRALDPPLRPTWLARRADA